MPATLSPSTQDDAYPGPDASVLTGYPAADVTAAAVILPLTPPQAPADAPPPEAHMASISGVLFAPATIGVIKGTDFFLRPLPPEGADPPAVVLPPQLDAGDVIARTDSNGEFALTNIPPGSYQLLVWAPYDWRPAKASQNSPDPLIISLTEGQGLALGVVYVDWP